jgi:hypothetical protein
VVFGGVERVGEGQRRAGAGQRLEAVFVLEAGAGAEADVLGHQGAGAGAGRPEVERAVGREEHRVDPGPLAQRERGRQIVGQAEAAVGAEDLHAQAARGAGGGAHGGVVGAGQAAADAHGGDAGGLEGRAAGEREVLQLEKSPEPTRRVPPACTTTAPQRAVVAVTVWVVPAGTTSAWAPASTGRARGNGGMYSSLSREMEP